MKKRPTSQGKPSAQARAHSTPQPPRPNTRAAEALALLKRDHLDRAALQGGNVAPELAAWLVLAVVAVLLWGFA